MEPSFLIAASHQPNCATGAAAQTKEIRVHFLITSGVAVVLLGGLAAIARCEYWKSHDLETAAPPPDSKANEPDLQTSLTKGTS
jgi:hypothetical protein